jgi:hypothetical protein
MDLGFLDVFPGFGFQNKVRFSGCDHVSKGFGSISTGFSVSFGCRIVWTIHSKDKVKMASPDRIGFFGQDWI